MSVPSTKNDVNAINKSPSGAKLSWDSLRPRVPWLVAVGILSTAGAWAYWPTLQTIAGKWQREPEYSHGFLVPIFAVVLLWLRRKMLEDVQFTPSWWGLPILIGGLALRQAGAYYYYEWFEFLSILPCVFGVCLLLCGWQGMRWAWPAIAFLVFMLPLPYRVEVAVREPLRTVGTRAAEYLMQAVGLPAIAEGHVIVVDEFRIGVVEACSGLRMLLSFMALSAAVALLANRPHWQRGLILLSGVPIALISNIARMTLTGILFVTLGSEIANWVFHDVAGWLMMPFGLALLWLELTVLDRIVIVEIDAPLKPVVGPNPVGNP